MRKFLIAANWKMNKPVQDFSDYISALNSNHNPEANCEIAIAASYPYLSTLQKLLNQTRIHLCAQNVHDQDKGAFTGEVSLTMLKDFGVSKVILGHSERRQYFAETDAQIAKKVQACAAKGMGAVLCIGETLEERKQNQTFAVLGRQIRVALADLKTLEHLVIAYEPVWAIGTGVSASSTQAQEAHVFIRGLVQELYGADVANGIQILYGGSMNTSNAEELLHQPDIDGGLVGGASLDAYAFANLVRTASQIHRS